MINLALFNESLAPLCDGVAMTVENYARIVSERYGQAYVITPAHPDRDPSNFPFPVWEYASSPITVADQYRVGIPSVPKLAKKFNETPIDIIHSHTPFTSGLLATRMPPAITCRTWRASIPSIRTISICVSRST